MLEWVKTLGDVGMGLMYFVHEKCMNWGVCKRRLLGLNCVPLKKKKKKHMLRTSQVVLEVKNLPANAGDVGDVSLIPGSGRSPRKGSG